MDALREPPCNHRCEPAGDRDDDPAMPQIDNQTIVGQMLSRQRDSISGVSLDEEMTDLIRFQKAFEASARLVSLVDDMLDTVVNMKR